MLMLRWIILNGLVLVLTGCGLGKKDKANVSKPGGGSEQSSPTHPWKRPPEDLQRPLPLKEPGKRDPF